MEDEAARLAGLLAGDSESRRRAYAEVESGDAAVAAAPAVADALLGVILSADLEAAEYREVAYLVDDLMRRTEGGFELQWCREQRWIRAWEAPVFLAVVGKPAAELVRDDALTAASNCASMATVCAKSWTGVHEAAGEDEIASIFKLPTHPLYPERMAANAGASRRLTELVLEICREPEGLLDEQLASVWFSLFFIITQRAELAAVTARGGIFDLGVSELRKHSPVELVKWTSGASLIAGGVQMALVHTVLTNPEGVDTLQLIIDSGIVECACAAFKAFELHGAGAVPQANALFYFHLVLMLMPLNLTGPEAKPITEQLRLIPSSLKFVLDHSLDHVKGMGMTTAALCAQVCACVFGKQEDGDFAFSAAQLEELLVFTKNIFDGR